MLFLLAFPWLAQMVGGILKLKTKSKGTEATVFRGHEVVAASHPCLFLLTQWGFLTNRLVDLIRSSETL